MSPDWFVKSGSESSGNYPPYMIWLLLSVFVARLRWRNGVKNGLQDDLVPERKTKSAVQCSYICLRARKRKMNEENKDEETRQREEKGRRRVGEARKRGEAQRSKGRWRSIHSLWYTRCRGALMHSKTPGNDGCRSFRVQSLRRLCGHSWRHRGSRLLRFGRKSKGFYEEEENQLVAYNHKNK